MGASDAAAGQCGGDLKETLARGTRERQQLHRRRLDWRRLNRRANDRRSGGLRAEQLDRRNWRLRHKCDV